MNLRSRLRRAASGGGIWPSWLVVHHHRHTTGEAPTTHQVEDWADQLNVGAAFTVRTLADAELIFVRDEAAAPPDQAPAVTGAVPFAPAVPQLTG